MNKSIVSIVRYEEPFESVRKAVELSRGLDQLPANARVFIKPNIVFWTKKVAFPKWGAITTTRMVQDMVVLLKERGIDDITIGEGIVTKKTKDIETPAHAFETLGYNELKRRYGVKSINVFERPFEEVDKDPRYQEFIPRAEVYTVLGYELCVASIKDVLAGKMWAYSDKTRRASKRQKDLADIMRLAETHPELLESLPNEIRTLLD